MGTLFLLDLSVHVCETGKHDDVGSEVEKTNVLENRLVFPVNVLGQLH